MSEFNCIVVLGPTASGKTRLACQLAYYLQGEIISADSRQVYKGLDIGTGKDLEEYSVNGQKINYHLIDVTEPGEQFYLHQFMQGLQSAFNEIQRHKHLPIICGGTGLYLDALRKDFSLTQIKEDEKLREALSSYSKQQLLDRLDDYPKAFTQQVDRSSAKRIIRGIEIAEHYVRQGAAPVKQELPYKPYYIGIDVDLETRRQRISQRLAKRLEHGLVEEVQQLLQKGLSPERLELLGLEYKFVCYYLQNKLSKEELFTQLQTAIFQFARRQMTWFRKMEKEGLHIHWVKGDADAAELARELNAYFQTQS